MNVAEIMNRRDALERFDGDEEFLKEIVQLFLDEASRMLAGVADAVRKRDAEGIAGTAHTLKGSVGNLCAEPTVEAARNLEMIGRQGDLDAARQAYAELEREMARLTPVLESIVDERLPAPARRVPEPVRG